MPPGIRNPVFHLHLSVSYTYNQIAGHIELLGLIESGLLSLDPFITQPAQ